MLKITKEGTTGECLEPFKYAKGRGWIGKMALRLTRWLRAVNVEKYMGPGERHLDIGCGDGYFLRRSPCDERFGLDKLLGDEITDRLDFPDSYFDYVTLLAVIEHMPDPEANMREIARVLKPKGKLILTTPKKSSEWILNLYSKDIGDEHEMYFDRESMERLCRGRYVMRAYHTFIFGLNQAFMLEKADPS